MTLTEMLRREFTEVLAEYTVLREQYDELRGRCAASAASVKAIERMAPDKFTYRHQGERA